jgi:hypothetical protein
MRASQWENMHTIGESSAANKAAEMAEGRLNVPQDGLPGHVDQSAVSDTGR